jgi:hypothetical protein
MGGHPPGMGYPTSPGQQFDSPPSFRKPVNAAHSYAPFENLKIQDMDAFLEHIPRMPLVLQPHDVGHDDWIRCMEVCEFSRYFGGIIPLTEITSRPRISLAPGLVLTRANQAANLAHRPPYGTSSMLGTSTSSFLEVSKSSSTKAASGVQATSTVTSTLGCPLTKTTSCHRNLPCPADPILAPKRESWHSNMVPTDGDRMPRRPR